MKQLFIFLFICLLSSSCTEKEYIPQEVEFSIDYTFSSGSMTKANSDIYDSFYQNHIVSRKLTPDSFTLTFVNDETGQKNVVSGLWSENGLIRLMEGTYTVTGKSYSADNYYALDKAYLTFDHKVTITKDMDKLMLDASWGGPLLFFSTDKTESVIYQYDSYAYHCDTLRVADGYFYCFLKDKPSYTDARFEINRKNGSTIKVYTSKAAFQAGNYYFFDDISGGFNLPPMEPGN